MKDALQTRDARVPDSEMLSSVRDKRRKKKRPARNLELARSSGQSKPGSSSTQGVASPRPPAMEAAEEEKGPPILLPEEVVLSRNRVTIRSPVNQPVTSGVEAGKLPVFKLKCTKASGFEYTRIIHESIRF